MVFSMQPHFTDAEKRPAVKSCSCGVFFCWLAAIKESHQQTLGPSTKILKSLKLTQPFANY